MYVQLICIKTDAKVSALKQNVAYTYNGYFVTTTLYLANAMVTNHLQVIDMFGEYARKKGKSVLDWSSARLSFTLDVTFMVILLKLMLE